MDTLDLVRESRLAAGTVVGVTAPMGTHEAAYAAIERFEAELSEWRPDSRTAALNRSGGPVRLSREGTRLFHVAASVERRSGGAFDLTFQGGRAWVGLSGVRATGPVALGGILKGFLADRAADALRAQGATRFLIDAGGDVVAAGTWTIEVVADGLRRTVELRDAALSTSAEDQQPGHIKDPRTGAPVTCSRSAYVIARDGTWADALATAVYASCGDVRLPAGATGAWVGADGERRELQGSIIATDTPAAPAPTITRVPSISSTAACSNSTSASRVW